MKVCVDKVLECHDTVYDMQFVECNIEDYLQYLFASKIGIDLEKT